MKLTHVAGIAVGCAVGVVVGMAAWHGLQAWMAERERAAAKAEADAFARTPQGIQQKVVRDRLVDPDSAKFKGDRASATEKDYWCGEVNGRNRMGAMTGFSRYVAWITLDHNKDITFSRVWLEPTSSSDRGEQAIFDMYWNKACVSK